MLSLIADDVGLFDRPEGGEKSRGEDVIMDLLLLKVA